VRCNQAGGNGGLNYNELPQLIISFVREVFIVSETFNRRL